MTGELKFIGKCIGFGLPYCVQFTNPEKPLIIDGTTGRPSSDGTTIPQAEANGLFMPQTLSATWLMMIDPKTNEPKPVYLEPEIIVSPFQLK